MFTWAGDNLTLAVCLSASPRDAKDLHVSHRCQSKDVWLNCRLMFFQGTSNESKNTGRANTMNVNLSCNLPLVALLGGELLFSFQTWQRYRCKIPIHHNNQCWVSIFQDQDSTASPWRAGPRGFILEWLQNPVVTRQIEEKQDGHQALN